MGSPFLILPVSHAMGTPNITPNKTAPKTSHNPWRKFISTIAPLTNPSTKTSIILNKIIPHASSSATTPSKVLLRGPFALLSSTRSIVAAGAVAGAIPASIKDIAIPAPNI